MCAYTIPKFSAWHVIIYIMHLQQLNELQLIYMHLQQLKESKAQKH